ncbi:hypothetical protein NEOLEDRAFT_1077982, partial [Neolentinus lepideus HHB14362 ss-1]
GYVLRTEPNIHDKWKHIFEERERDDDGDVVMDDKSGTGTSGKSNPFFPFSSELDWRVAKWAKDDGPGQKVFDLFLAIPGVHTLYNHN